MPCCFARLDRIIGCVEGGGVELAFFGLDAEVATDGVAEGLGTDDFGAHLLSGGEGIVDFEVAGVAGTLRIVRAVAFQAEPLNIGSAVAEGGAGAGSALSLCVARRRRRWVSGQSRRRRASDCGSIRK